MSTNKVVKLPEKKSASQESQEPVIEPRHKTYEAEQAQNLPEN